MGDPKKSRKIFRRPRQIWTTEQLSSELFLIGSYGLRSKSELWKAQTKVADIRNQARELLALTIEQRQTQETKLLNFLHKVGLVKESATLDDVLNLKLEDILERRLQTIIMKKGISKSPQQSRQLVVHGHVSILSAGRNHSIKINSSSFERVEQFKYLGTTPMNKNSI